MVLAFAIKVEMPVFRTVCWLKIVLTPTVALLSDVDSEVKALRPEETWALVGEAASATMVEIAVEKRTASEVVCDSTTLPEVAPDKAVELTVEVEVPAEISVETAPEREVCDDKVVLTDDERAVAADKAADVVAETEVSPDRVCETTETRDVSAEAAVETETVVVMPFGSTACSAVITGKASSDLGAVPRVQAMIVRPVMGHSNFGRRNPGRTAPGRRPRGYAAEG